MMQDTMIAAQRQGSHSQSCRNTGNWGENELRRHRREIKDDVVQQIDQIGSVACSN
jgi:hypothetical protein